MKYIFRIAFALVVLPAVLWVDGTKDFFHNLWDFILHGTEGH